MKSLIAKKADNKSQINFIISAARLIKNSTISKPTGERKAKPKVIQLPITYKCNSRCVMCNIWKMDHSNEATLEEFREFLNDSLFSDVRAVGINGGEPSLIKTLPTYAKEILKLPSLRSLNIISHGFNKKLLLNAVEKIYLDCKSSGVNFHVSISLDGFGTIHDDVRRIKGAFNKTSTTIEEIQSNQSRYCDSFDLGCTVVKQNVNHLVALDNYVSGRKLKIKYRLGIENKRIESDQIRDQYSVINSEEAQSASEFFHWQYSRARRLDEKFKYFSIFYWLTSPKPKRLMGCAWREQGVTMDSRGSLYYCAVASKEIGSLRSESGSNVFFNEENISYRKDLIKNSCDSCIHDYSGKARFADIVFFLRSLFQKRFAMRWFRVRLAIGWI